MISDRLCYRCSRTTSRMVCGQCGGRTLGRIDVLGDIQARTTVGSSFIAPEPDDEALAARLASFLYGKVAMREDHATQSAAAEDYARNLAQFLILDYDIKPKRRTGKCPGWCGSNPCVCPDLSKKRAQNK